MAMPAQKPGKSKQDYGTSKELIAAIERRFGAINFDLAAHAENTKCKNYYNEEQNSLEQDWTKLEGNLWLNPPFKDIAPWAEKCKNSISPNIKILFLVPASIGSNWFADYVIDFSNIYILTPRITFEDCSDPYIKDCILCIYGEEKSFFGLDYFKWKRELPCKKCNEINYMSDGSCENCYKNYQKKWRKDHPYKNKIPSNTPCAICGFNERYNNGDCKECAKKRADIYHAKRLSAEDGQEYQKHKSFQARLTKYKLTKEEYEIMLANQNGLCDICHKAKATHIDHDHQTGIVRGILCPACNLSLGGFRDSIDNLKSAVIYLEKNKL